MDVLLHLGAHRTATTAVQMMLNRNRPALMAQGVAYIGPGWLRRMAPLRARTALQRALARVVPAGPRAILISEENLLGTMPANLRAGALYPQARAALEALRSLLPAPPRRIALTLRGYDDYWASVIAHLVGQGATPPDHARLAQLAAGPRGWPDLIADVAGVFPQADLSLSSYDLWQRDPQGLMRRLAPTVMLLETGGGLMNGSPDRSQIRQQLIARGQAPLAVSIPAGRGKWMPFAPALRAQMQDRYAADLHSIQSTWGPLADPAFCRSADRDADPKTPPKALAHPGGHDHGRHAKMG